MPDALTVQDLRKLSLADRLRLLDLVWESITPEQGQQVIPQWHLEVVRERLAQYLANPGTGMDADEFLDSLGNDE